jgi:hypothetical protein
VQSRQMRMRGEDGLVRNMSLQPICVLWVRAPLRPQVGKLASIWCAELLDRGLVGVAVFSFQQYSVHEISDNYPGYAVPGVDEK